MKVKQIVEQLKEYKQDSEFEIVIGGYPEYFEFCYSGAEGGIKKTFNSVCLYIKKFNNEEKK